MYPYYIRAVLHACNYRLSNRNINTTRPEPSEGINFVGTAFETALGKKLEWVIGTEPLPPNGRFYFKAFRCKNWNGYDTHMLGR
jgi:hypothetical protein